MKSFFKGIGLMLIALLVQCGMFFGSMNLAAAQTSSASLRILNATYGQLNQMSASKHADVTKQAHGMIQNNNLRLAADYKINVFSVADPSPNEGKGLLIVYAQGQNMYYNLSNDNAAVSIPNKNAILLYSGIANPASGFQVLKAVYGDLNYASVAQGKEPQVSDVTAKVQGMVRGNQLSFTASTKNILFGDPAYGIVKGLLIFYMVDQQIYMQIIGEYDAGTISPTEGGILLCPAAALTSAQSTLPVADILACWYGVDGATEQDLEAVLAGAPAVMSALQDSIAACNGAGFVIPANQLGWYSAYGLASEPVPGRLKTTAIALNMGGQRISPDLRAIDGVDFIYPSTLPAATAQAALAAMKAKITLPPSSATGGPNILGCWYGVDGATGDDLQSISAGAPAVMKALIDSIIACNGKGFVIPANQLGWYSAYGLASEPVPGKAKTTAIALNMGNQRISPDLRAADGVDFIYPSTLPEATAQAALAAMKAKITLPPSSATGGPNILACWYGVDGATGDDLQTISAGAPAVMKALQDSIAACNGAGFVIPANQLAWYSAYGLAGEPVPGKAKTTAIALNMGSQRISPDLRAADGVDFIYPSTLPAATAQAALAAMKAKMATSAPAAAVIDAQLAQVVSTVSTRIDTVTQALAQISQSVEQKMADLNTSFDAALATLVKQQVAPVQAPAVPKVAVVQQVVAPVATPAIAQAPKAVPAASKTVKKIAAKKVVKKASGTSQTTKMASKPVATKKSLTAAKSASVAKKTGNAVPATKKIVAKKAVVSSGVKSPKVAATSRATSKAPAKKTSSTKARSTTKKLPQG